MITKIITRYLPSPETFQIHEIDYSDKRARIWLSQHILWALHNSHSVTVFVENSNG